MKWTDAKQNILYAIILLVVAFLCFSLYPRPKITVHGIYLPFAASRPAVATDSVILVGKIPANGVVLGHIRAVKHFTDIAGIDTERNILDIENYTKTLAATHGGNAIYINRIGRTLFEGPLDGFQVMATVLYIK